MRNSKKKNDIVNPVGRPKIGVSRALRITLPLEEWDRIDKLVEDEIVKTQSEYFRLAHMAQWDERQIEWRIPE
ncbi:hypothetical protein D3C81_2285290 [compost metagenome]